MRDDKGEYELEEEHKCEFRDDIRRRDATDADGDEDDDARVDVLSLFRSSSFLFFFSSRSFLKKEEKLTTNNVITTIFLRSRWF